MKRYNSVAITVLVRFRFGFSVYVKQSLRPIHIYTKAELKRNRAEKIKCLKPNERFHICTETETELKPIAEPKTWMILILFFSVSVDEFQQTRQVILIKSAWTTTWTTTCVVYNLVIMKAIDGLSSETTVRLFYKHNTRGDQKVLGKVLLNRIALSDCNENS